MNVAVIGAGPAGLTAAYQLVKLGHNVTVFESSNTVGGMSKTISLWGQKVDIGPHRFFSNDLKVNELWLELAQNDYVMIDRLTRIYYNGKFYHYPLKAFDALKKIGILEAFNCLSSYCIQIIKNNKNNENFEDWVTNRFGKRLFEIFFKTYSEKLWGISCKELDSDFAAQRIKKLSLFEALYNALFSSNKLKHKTLVDQFAYPKTGSGMIYERMASYITQNNSTIHLSTPVKQLIFDNQKVIGLELENHQQHFFDHVISSMPLNLLFSRIPNVPQDLLQMANELKFRNTVIVYLKTNSTELFKDNWLYIHSQDISVGRITNFRNWSKELYGSEKESIIALEFWCNEDDDAWKKNENEWIEFAINELVKTQLVEKSLILEGSMYKIPRCYPVYNLGYKKNLIPIQNYLNQFENLHLIGRYGSFKYNNQDHSILMGMKVAENIHSNANHNLWDINTDTEYQEKAIITKTGLTKQ